MSLWNPADIKNLRLRLAWSAAEFSRRFGGSVQLIQDWEAGIKSPTELDMAQFESLEFHLNTYCELISRESHAESVLSEKLLEQVHNSQLFGKKIK